MILSIASRNYILNVIESIYEDYDIKTLPIDPFYIANKMNIKIKYMSELIKKHPDIKEIISYSACKDGYSCYDRNTNKFIVLLNDIEGNSKERINFTLSHEIGHPTLEHNGPGIPNEMQANVFAAELLMPSSVVLNIYPKFRDYKILKSIFPVSEQVYDYTMNRLKKRLNQKYINLTSIEKKIYYRFKDSLGDNLRELKNKFDL